MRTTTLVLALMLVCVVAVSERGEAQQPLVIGASISLSGKYAASAEYRASARSRCAWNTRNVVDMPAAYFFCSASSRRSINRSVAWVEATRFWLVSTCRATSRTEVATCSSRF